MAWWPPSSWGKGSKAYITKSTLDSQMRTSSGLESDLGMQANPLRLETGLNRNSSLGLDGLDSTSSTDEPTVGSIFTSPDGSQNLFASDPETGATYVTPVMQEVAQGGTAFDVPLGIGTSSNGYGEYSNPSISDVIAGNFPGYYPPDLRTENQEISRHRQRALPELPPEAALSATHSDVGGEESHYVAASTQFYSVMGEKGGRNDYAAPYRDGTSTYSVPSSDLQAVKEPDYDVPSFEGKDMSREVIHTVNPDGYSNPAFLMGGENHYSQPLAHEYEVVPALPPVYSVPAGDTYSHATTTTANQDKNSTYNVLEQNESRQKSGKVSKEEMAATQRVGQPLTLRAGKNIASAMPEVKIPSMVSQAKGKENEGRDSLAQRELGNNANKSVGRI